MQKGKYVTVFRAELSARQVEGKDCAWLICALSNKSSLRYNDGRMKLRTREMKLNDIPPLLKGW